MDLASLGLTPVKQQAGLDLSKLGLTPVSPAPAPQPDIMADFMANPDVIARPAGPAAPITGQDLLKYPQSSGLPAQLGPMGTAEDAEFEDWVLDVGFDDDAPEAYKAQEDEYIGRQAKARVDQMALEEAVANPSGDSMSDMRNREKYFTELPLPMDAPVFMDEGLVDRYTLVNELILGKPLATTPPKEAPARQKLIDEQRALMKEAGIDNPIEWIQSEVAKQEVADGDGLLNRMSKAFTEGGVRQIEQSTAGLTNAILDNVGLGEVGDRVFGGDAEQKRRGHAESWNAGIREQKDKQSAVGEFASSTLTDASQALGQITAAALTGRAAGLGQNAVFGQMGAATYGETYNNLRAQGWEKKDAFTYAATTAAIEVLTEKAGAALASTFKFVNPEGALLPKAKKVFEEAFARGGIRQMVGKAAAAGAGEGSEEVLADALNSVKDALYGLDPQLFGSKSAGEQAYGLAKTFTTGALAGLAGNVPAAAAFLLDPSRKTAKDLGIPTSSFKQEDLAQIAEDAKKLVSDMGWVDPTAEQPATAPESPVQATPENVTHESPVVAEAPQPASPEPVSQPEAPAATLAEAKPTEKPKPEGGAWQSNVNGVTVGIEKTKNGWVSYKVENGVRIEKGGDPRSGGYTRDEAQAAAQKELGFLQSEFRAQQEKPKPVDPDLDAITKTVTAALPKSKATVARGKDGYEVSFPNGAKFNLKEVDQVPATDKEITKGLSDYQMEDTPENREIFRNSIRGKFKLGAYDAPSVVHLRAQLGKAGSEVMRHEAVHFARQSGLIEDAEWSELVEKVQTGASKLEAKQQEELVARYIQTRPATATAARLREVFTKILALMGIEQSAADKLETAMRSGSVFADPVREEKAAPTPPAAAEGAKKTDPIPVREQNKPGRKLYQGRGATPEEVYGREAVEQGRAVPLLGPGNYYATSSKDAENYGKQVSEHDDVELKKPYVLDSDAGWAKLLKDSGADHLDNMGPKFYQDPKGIPAATKKLQDYLNGKGYDGVEVKVGGNRRLAEMFGHDQVAVFGEAKAEPKAKQLRDVFGDELKSGKKYRTIVEARKAASEFWGKPVKPGTPEAKQVDEAVEAGVVSTARDIIEKSKTREEAFDNLLDLYKRQPRLAVRDSTSMQLQAFSTPAPLAYLAQHLGGALEDGAKVIDSSAGNGMLLTGVPVGNLYANEIQKSRVENLQALGGEITEGDATRDLSKDFPKVDSVIINPPFGQDNTTGKTKTWEVDGEKYTEIDHAITLNTLKLLKDGGKATIIIGAKGVEKQKPKDGNEGMDRANSYLKHKKFFDRLYDNYNVVDHFTVAGDLYARQGASFPVDVIVVDGKGAATRQKPWKFMDGGLPQFYDSWESLKDAKLNANPTSADRTGGPSTDSVEPEVAGVEPVPVVSRGRGSEDGGGEQRPAGGNRGGVRGKNRKQPRVQQPKGASEPPVVPGQPGDTPGGPGVANDESGGSSGRSPGTDGLPTDSSLDQAELDRQMEEALIREGVIEPKSKPKAAPKKKPAAKKTIQDKAAKAREEAAADIKNFLDELKKITPTATSTGIDPRLLGLAAKAAASSVRAGVYTFAEFADSVISQAPQMTDTLAPYLESAWRVIHKNDTTGKVGPVGKVSDLVAKTETETKKDTETEFQKTYVQRSQNDAVGTLLPANHVTAVARALDNIVEQYGNIDEFVAKELKYSAKEMKVFSAEQVDALAMAIANDKKGDAFIVGDQTGVGKGRVVAAMMKYAENTGRIPVFVTEKPSLFADMMRDLTDIGMNPADKPFNPLMTNGLGGNDRINLHGGLSEEVRKKRGDRIVTQDVKDQKRIMQTAIDTLLGGGNLEAGVPAYGPDHTKLKGKQKREDLTKFNAIFTTYSQLDPEDNQEPWRATELRRIMPRSFFILDESHNAGGTKKSSRFGKDDDGKNEKLQRSEIFRDLIRVADNVFYSSATFAKRPDVMDLYARAGLGRAVEDVSKLGEIVSEGGVPLQQALSEQLAEAGLYLRRERSYDGVEFAPKVAEIDLGTADLAAKAFRKINDFSDSIQAAIKEVQKRIVSEGGKLGEDNATGKRGMESTTFSSSLHNVTNQMLFALKADKVADEAIAAWKAGEAPVIAFDETMETKLQDFIDDNNLAAGDMTNYTFRDLLRGYLERSRHIVVKKDVDKKDSWYKRYLTDAEIGPEGVEAYERASEVIDAFDAELPASPIDWIRHRLTEAGMTVSEITGRKVGLDYSSGMRTPTVNVRSKKELGNSGKQATVKGFNTGKIDAILLNRSGSTGLSIHAHPDFKHYKTGEAPRRRHMLIAQPAGNIDEFMQMLGRIHRTGQMTDRLPKYTLFLTNAPAENRPAAVLVKKLASLNANVTASAKGSVSFDVPDVINSIGDKVVAAWIEEHPHYNEEMGEPVEIGRKGVKSTPDIAKKVSGRMTIMDVEVQQKFWEDIVTQYNQVIDELNAINANPLVAQTLELDAKTLEKFAITTVTDSESEDPFTQPAYLEKVSAKSVAKPMTTREVGQKVKDFYGSDDVVKASREWKDKTLNDARKAAQEWLKGQQEAILKRRVGKKNPTDEDIEAKRVENEKAALALKDKTAEQFSDIYNLVNNRAPGHEIDIILEGQPFRGIVIAVNHSNSSGNPIAPSKWTMDVAFASEIRRLAFPLTRLKDGTVTNGPFLNPETLKDTNTGRMFDHLQSDTRTNRYIGTGNILAGFSQLKEAEGKIVFYTDNEGNKKRGILMPDNFNVDKWQSERPVIFQTAAKVLEFVENGGHAATVDGNLQIYHAGDNVVLIAPLARSKSGHFTTSKAILDAANGQVFNSKGSRMEMLLPPGRSQEAVLEAVMGISSIQTTSGKELARRLGNDSSAMSLRAPRKDITRQTRSTAVRIPGEEGEKIAAQDIIKTWSRIFQVPIGKGGFNLKAAGLYFKQPRAVRLRYKYSAALGVAMHEIAHHIDQLTGVGREKTTTMPDDIQSEVRGLDYDKFKNRLFEGWAEFIRMWVTEQDVRQKAPRATRWLEKVWFKEHPEIAAKLEKARTHARKFADQSVLKRVSSLIGGPGTDLEFTERWKSEINSGVSRFMHRHIDKWHGLKQITDRLTAAGYKGINAYQQAMRFAHTAVAEAEKMLKEGAYSVRNTKKFGTPGLWAASQYINSDAERIEAISYAHARFTLWARKNLPGYNTAMDADDALRLMNKLDSEGKKDRYTKFAQVIAEYNNGLLDMAADAGAISRDLRDKLVDMYGDNYFPMVRERDGQSGIFAGSRAFANLPDPLRRRSKEGSGERILDPFDASIARTVHLIERSHKARVMSTLIQALDPQLGGMEGFGDILQRVSNPNRVTPLQAVELLDDLVKQGIVEKGAARAMRIAARVNLLYSLSGAKAATPAAAKLRARVQGKDRDFLLKKHGYDPLTADVTDLIRAAQKEPDILEFINLYRADLVAKNGKLQIMHIVDGSPVLYELNEDLHRIVTAADEETLEIFTKGLKFWATTFKLGAIGLNTAFAAKNLVRDYIGYQGRAKYSKGIQSLTDPWAVMAEYVHVKTIGKFTGRKSALIELMESTGGKMYTRLATTSGRNKVRRQELGANYQSRLANAFVMPLETIKATLAGGISALENIIAISDIPPRLSEMKRAIESEGYVHKLGVWYDAKSGKPVRNLPEYVIIKAVDAFGNATVNFKRSGSKMTKVEAALPLTRAGINAVYRSIELAANMKNYERNGGGDKATQARRYALYATMMMASGVAYWLAVHDDDEYRAATADERARYWILGDIRIPKPQDEGIFSTVAEAVMDNLHHSDDTVSMGQTLGYEAMSRVPAGGGILKGAAEVAMNYDMFRERPIYFDPSGKVPASYQYDNYTLESSKWMGYYTGKVSGIGPKELEHLLNAATGAEYRRLMSAYEDPDKLQAKNIPFVGAFFASERQARQVDEFWQTFKATGEEAYGDKMEGFPRSQANAEFDRLEGYQRMMVAISKAEPRDDKGRRTFEYSKYQVGLACEALGKPMMDDSPSPFTDKDTPEAIRKVIQERAFKQAEVALLSHGRPEVPAKDKTFSETVLEWEDKRRAASQWLFQHKESPWVKAGIKEVSSDPRFSKARYAKYPKYPSQKAIADSGMPAGEFWDYLQAGWENDKQQAESMAGIIGE